MELGKLTREERNILVGENIEVVSNFKPYLAHNGFRRPYNSVLSVNGATLPFSGLAGSLNEQKGNLRQDSLTFTFGNFFLLTKAENFNFMNF